jgi:glutamyl-tRNA synthetase
MSVRVRFAPSPTGSLHLGSALAALANYLFARKHAGSVLLRIDDTDRARSRPELEQAIADDLRWLGLDWDEGPVRQSDRFARYRDAAVDAAGVERRDGALVLRAPPAPVAVPDVVRGEIPIAVGDVVIVRSDGRATYNWATAVDEIDLGITHVVRGEDHLANTAAQVAAITALGAAPPAYAHVGLLLDEAGKLSKRAGAASVADLRAAGFPPEAVVNYLGLLATSGPGDVLTLMELVDRFDLARLARGGLLVDPERLRNLSARHLARVPAPELAARVLPFCPPGTDREQVEHLAPALRGVHTLRDAAALVASVLEPPARSPLPELAAVRERYPDRLLSEEQARALVAELRERGVPLRQARVALTGRDRGPELWAVLAAIPRDEAIRRAA